MMRIIMSGPPASGKGTQCEKIATMYGVKHLSSGDLLRAEVAAGTEIGLKAKAFMDAGKLVPDDIVVPLVAKQLMTFSAGWLLDGFPRSADQAAALTRLVSPHVVVVLDLPDQVAIERITGRRTDPVTNKVYHVKFNPATDPIVTARLVQRDDDTEVTMTRRLALYRASEAALCAAFGGLVHHVNANLPIPDVFNQISGILTPLKASL
ncbi:adenylate kinase [Pelomyxa schiedti]|nr:adenylate kinase [Pelomyxa schiedti]